MLTDLEVLFSSTARVHILGLFVQNPRSQFYQREIERETGQAIRAVQREVERLEGIGLLVRSEEGNRVYYGLNPDFPLLPELAALFHRAGGTAGYRSAGSEAGTEMPTGEPGLPPEPSTIRQPFPWMETLPTPQLPPALRHLQVAGEWDRAY